MDDPRSRISSNELVIGRRQALLLLGAGMGGLAGCLGVDPDDEPADERLGNLSVEVRSDVDREFRAEVALVEGDQSFEAARLAQFTFATVGDTHGISKPDVTGGPYRVVVRLFDHLEEQELTHSWDLDRCIELHIRLTVGAEEVAASVGCTHVD